MTLGLRPLGLPPGSQGSAALLIVLFYALKNRGAHTSAAAAEIADARGSRRQVISHVSLDVDTVLGITLPEMLMTDVIPKRVLGRPKSYGRAAE